MSIIDEKSKRLKSYLEKLIDKDPELRIDQIKSSNSYKSIRNIAIELKTSKLTVKKMILSYLNNEFGLIKAKAIYKLIWPSSLSGMNQKRSSLKNLLENQLFITQKLI